jgi:Flp pilus assembly protein TadG
LKGGDSLSRAGYFPRGGRKGQSLVEFAIALPLLVLIMFGVLDLGRAFFSLITIHNAAREGARYGTLYPDDLDSIPEKAKKEANNSGINPNDLTVTYVCAAPCGPLTVSVSYEFKPIMGILPYLFPGGKLDIKRSITMMVPDESLTH